MNRFKDLNWFEDAKNYKVTLIGSGGIGSWAAILLARAGIKPVIFDHDIVDASNISGQFFFKDQINQEKVKAIADTIHYFGGNIDIALTQKFNINTDDKYVNPITIIGTDNMKSRRDSFKIWFNKYENNLDTTNTEEIAPMFVDGRLLAESFQIFCIKTLNDARNYEDNYLFEDSEIPEVSCTAKQTTHYAAMIAANIVRFVTNHISSKNGLPTYVPFIYELNGVLSDTVKIAEYTPEKEII